MNWFIAQVEDIYSASIGVVLDRDDGARRLGSPTGWSASAN
jgi:hypothetical protein